MGRSQCDYVSSKVTYHELRKKAIKERRILKYAFWNEMSTLLPSGGTNGSVPRVDKLQTLEAKMANIEMSLGWRRRREALLETLPRAARDLVRELDSLHQTVREKETCIQGLRTQITNLGGTVSGAIDGGGGAHISETEKKSIQERLEKVKAEIDVKKVSVKNLKLTLDKIDITDNIDVRIRAAELEYELEREELNILNLKEEVSILTTKLQESCATPPTDGNANGVTKGSSSFQDLLSIPGSFSAVSGASLLALTVTYTPGNPPFHVTYRAPNGCVIDWATDDTRLKKGDRIVEINRQCVIGKEIEEVTKLMSEAPLLTLVIARPSEIATKKLEKQLEDKGKENKDLVAKLDKALKERDTLKNDNTRLNHRISYLEDQVSELQGTIQKAKEAALTTGSHNEVLTPSHPGATIIQVFQKGDQTLAVAGPDLEKTEDRVQEYPTLPRIKSPSSSSTESGSTSRMEEKEQQIREVDSSYERALSPPTSEKYVSHSNQRHSSRTPSEKSFNSTRHSESFQTPPKHNNRTQTPSSTDEYSEYQKTNYSRVPSRKSDNRIYDSIDKLRDTISERSPSYSYKNHDSYAIDASDRYEDSRELDSQRQKRSTRENEYNTSEEIYSKTMKYSKRSDSEIDNRSIEGRISVSSRPSSRENMIEQMEERMSRSTMVYDRPHRRLLSPGSEDSRASRPRPIPPKKPERLSLQRTTSMMSVEDSRPCSRTSSKSNTCRSQQNGYSYQHYDSDAHTEDYNSIYSDDKINRYREVYSKRPSSRVSSICEERFPSPSPRNISNKGLNVNGSNSNSKDQRRLTISSIDSSIYDSPLANSSPIKQNGHNNYSRSKSPDASFHLDTTLGLDHHQDVRAQPLYEYLPRVGLNTNHQSSYFPKPSVRKSQERDAFQAPPTPNTPPRGINLSMKSPQKTGEEWC